VLVDSRYVSEKTKRGTPKIMYIPVI